MAMKTTQKKIEVEKILSEINVREAEGLDIQALLPSIVALGAITTPLVVEKHPTKEGFFRCLQGHRRRECALWILSHPDQYSKTLVESVEKLQCNVLEGLTDKEREEVIMDQGQQKPLTHVEIVKAVWRLLSQGFSEMEVARTLFQQLAAYTGNTDKLAELSGISDPKLRDSFLRKWLAGTLRQKLVALWAMPQFVKDAFILSERKKDRPLSEAEKKELMVDFKSARIGELDAARKEDLADGKWDIETGGPWNDNIEDTQNSKFNRVWNRILNETRGVSDVAKNTVPSKTVLTNLRNNSKSSAIKTALSLAVGERNGKPIDELDTEMYRVEQVLEVLKLNLEKVENFQVRELLAGILYQKGAEVQKRIEPLLKAQ